MPVVANEPKRKTRKRLGLLLVLAACITAPCVLALALPWVHPLKMKLDGATYSLEARAEPGNRTLTGYDQYEAGDLGTWGHVRKVRVGRWSYWLFVNWRMDRPRPWLFN